jgi:DNA-directed RNA polymerase subunit M/transcription elongation factor TFIIS
MRKGRAWTINIFCSKCNTLLYKYRKEGRGHLIKCYKSRIAGDYTKGDLKCPKCGESFAREAMIHGKPANKISQGKVYVKW